MIRSTVIIGVLAAISGPASAQPEPTDHVDAPAAKAPLPALSYKRAFFRAGLVRVAPQTRSRELVLSDVHGPASLAIMDGPIAGSGVGLDAVTMPAAILGYTLPVLGDRLAIETVLGPPLHVKFRGTGSLADMSIAPTALGLPTGVPALGPSLGEADALPPIVTAVYHPVELGPVSPYLGSGLAILYAYNPRATNPVLTEVGEPRLHVSPGAGWAFQAGLDARLWRRVYARLDVKYVAFLKAHATVDNISVATPDLPLFGQASVGTATLDVWINPLIVQLAIGADL